MFQKVLKRGIPRDRHSSSICGDEDQIIVEGGLMKLSISVSARGSLCINLMNINDTWGRVHVQLSLPEAKNDFYRAEIFLVECQILLKFTPGCKSEMTTYG